MNRRTFVGGLGATTALGALAREFDAVAGATDRQRGRPGGVTAEAESGWGVDWRFQWPEFGRRPQEIQAVVGGDRLFLTPRVAGFPEREAEFEDETMVAPWVHSSDGSKGSGTGSAGISSSAAPAATLWIDGWMAFVGLASEGERTWVAVGPPDDGRAGWGTELDGAPAGPPAETGGRIFVSAGERLVALAVADGRVEWTTAFEAPVTGTTAVDGAVYATTADGGLSALDPASGDRRWTADGLATGRLRGPAVAGDRVLALDPWGGVHAVGVDGSVAWSTVPDGVVTPDDTETVTPDDAPGTVGSVGVDGDRCYVAAVVGDRERTVVAALSLTDGTEDWTYEFASAPHRDVHSVRNGPTFQPRAAAGGVWAAGRRTAVALDPATGELRRRWAFQFDAIAPPLPTDDAVYLFDWTGAYRLARSGADCAAPAVDGATVDYVNRMGDQSLSVNGSMAVEDCPAFGAVDLVVDGEYRASAGGYLTPEDGGLPWFGYDWPELPDDVDHATLRFRGTAGTVVDSRRVAVDDYREEPADFTISCPSLSTTQLGFGTNVATAFQISNSGADPEYVATLEADGTVVARERGSIARRFHDDGAPCDGTTVRLSTLFLGFDARDLRVRVEPVADEGSGDVEALETVESGSPYALGGAGAGLALFGTYVRRKIRASASD